MTKFFTSDLHIGHTNILTYCNRPYEGVNEMNWDLVERWNSVVSDDDEVYVVGDFAMGKLDESLAYVQYMNGTKYLIPGNHDRMFNCQGVKYANMVKKYTDAGFTDVLADILPIDLSENMRVTVCHFPYVGDSNNGQEDRFVEQRPKDRGQRLLHGHTHGIWRRNGRLIDVGVDAWGGYPVSSETLEELFMADEMWAGSIAWRN